VANTQFSSFPILSGTFSNKILGASNNLTLNFNPTAPITGYLLITIADSFTIGSLACLSYTGTCIANGNILNISGNFNTGSNTITITGLTSPLTSPTDFTSVVSYDSSGYIIDSNTNTIIFIPACTLPCKTCVTNMVTCTSCYNNTAISVMVYYLSVNNSCVSSCPNGYFTDAANLLCIACSSPCKTCSGSTNNCTSCVSGSSFPYLNVTSGFVGTCLTQCPAGMFPDTSQLVPICTMCQSPCSTCTSSNVCLTCVSPYYMYSGICANTCPDNITITNTVTRVCDLCAPVCSTCSITTTNCTNCSAIAFLYLGNCVSTCPSPLVINNGTCGGCELPCLTCVQISTNCTSCDTTTSTPHLLNNSCITSCPIKYYNTSNTSVCMSCADLNINCDLCINQTTCSSACNTGYVYLNGTCLGVTPAGYVNISSIAQPCLGDCATCSINQTNCLSCKTLNLSGNFCVSSCPVGTASINMICTACNSPCLTCLGSVTSCLSCDPSYSPAVYLSGTRCVTSCPSGTYTNDTNNECTTCTNQCLTCTSASSCLSCISGYSLFSNTCSQGCQSGYVSVNQICLACLFTCGTCSINQYNCTSCLATLSPKQYLTGNSCVQTCPDTFYGNISTLLCTQCPSPCYTCSSTSICTSCLDGYSLSFNGSSCLVSCPAGYYSSNKLCEPCATGCNTCSNTNTTCTTCSSGYYMVAASSSCVTTCPSGLYPEAVSQTCVGCQSPCSSCTGNQINCTSCISGKNLLGNTCVDSCPTAWYN
jgi:proprotein convertase subtilisin/kexin type 5